CRSFGPGSAAEAHPCRDRKSWLEGTRHRLRATVPTGEVRPATPPRPANHEPSEVLGRPCLIRILVDAPVAIDRFHTERIRIGAEVRVHGRCPFPLDPYAGRVRAQLASPRDLLDTPGEVDRNLEPHAGDERIAVVA